MVTPEEIAQVAHLARLDIPDDKLSTYTPQLERILAFVAQLEELDVSGVEPMRHATGSDNVFRDDEPGECLTNEDALANAPEADAPYFRVPRTI